MPRPVTRIMCAFAATASVALSLTACAPGASGGAEDVTISYAIWDQTQKPAMEEIAAAFEKENPNVTVDIQLTPWEQYWTKLQTAATGGAAADVFWMNGPNVRLYASNGVIAPLDGVDESAYPTGLMSMYSYEDQLFAIPKDLDTRAVWYNKALFDAAGMDYPAAGWTWDDFIEMAARLTDATKGQYGTASFQEGQTNYYNSIAQAGGEVIDADGTKTGYDSPEALAGITLWTDLMEAGSSPSATQMVDTAPFDMFLSGKVAMFWGGSWSARALADSELADEFDVAPFPAGAAGNQSVIHGVGNAANAKSPHLDVAKEFVAFASGEEAGKIQAATGATIPSYDGTQGPWVDTFPNYDVQVFLDAVDTAVPYPISKNTSAWTSIESETLSQIWAGSLPASDGLGQLAEKMQAALDAEQE